MVLCQVIRASSTVGVSALTTFARLNAHTKYTSCIRKFGVSSAAFSGKILFFIIFSIWRNAIKKELIRSICRQKIYGKT